MPIVFLIIYAVGIYVIVRKTQPDQPRWYASVVTLAAVAIFGGAYAGVATLRG